MHDPHPIDTHGWDTCSKPTTARLGDEWTCPDCGRAYYAADDDGDGTFAWLIDPTADQPNLPLPE